MAMRLKDNDHLANILLVIFRQDRTARCDVWRKKEGKRANISLWWWLLLQSRLHL